MSRSHILALVFLLAAGCPVAAAAQFDDVDEADDAATAADAPADQPAPAETLGQQKDEEIAETKTEDPTRIQVDFWNLGSSGLWHQRDGLGFSVALGGLTCARDYCNTTIDTQIAGSAMGAVGAYYRLNPNFSGYAEVTFAYLNTNFSPAAVGGSAADKDGGFSFSTVVGGRFHLPVKDWLNLYAGGGLGFILLRAKAEVAGDVIRHRWGGIDIQVNLGADFYFFSDGPARDLSIGPFVRFEFPIWPRVCEEIGGVAVCDNPGGMPNGSQMLWDQTPVVFATGFEARWDFGLFAP